eukprot:TRINITY_DN2199_c0_g2_i3.p1 TRINITY_DN2199_c0_g2~~TRINITY_DN2199_c0_g2_i3.p1  ORF type:complete len:373 (-),score=111.70 TRINITY_DN2199_c0_g2_i3:112-1116(-)
MGLDIHAIEEQVATKKKIQEQEKLRDLEFAKELTSLDRQFSSLQSQQAEYKKRQHAQQQQENWILAAQKRGTRDSLAKLPIFPEEIPAETLGASSMMKFEGEDPNAKTRTLQQRQQMKEWADRKLQEKLDLERRKTEEDGQIIRRMSEINEKTREMEVQRSRAKHAAATADAEYNRFLAETKKEAERQFKVTETFDNIHEIQSQMSSDVLNESKNAVSSISPSRVIPYEFKGMSPDRRRKILEEQERQRAEKEAAKKREEEEKRAEAAQLEATKRALLLKEREAQRKREEMERQVREEQRIFAEQQKEKLKRAKMESVSTPTDDFFSQFGTSSR